MRAVFFYQKMNHFASIIVIEVVMLHKKSSQKDEDIGSFVKHWIIWTFFLFCGNINGYNAYNE